MMRPIAYCVYREEEFFVAQCLNVDVSSFGATREEAVTNLKEAVELYFEGEEMTPTRIFHSRTAMNMFSRIAITAIISILFMNTIAFAQQTASRVVTMRADTSAQEEAKAPVKSIQAPVVKSSKTGVVEIEAAFHSWADCLGRDVALIGPDFPCLHGADLCPHTAPRSETEVLLKSDLRNPEPEVSRARER